MINVTTFVVKYYMRLITLQMRYRGYRNFSILRFNKTLELRPKLSEIPFP